MSRLQKALLGVLAGLTVLALLVFLLDVGNDGYQPLSAGHEPGTAEPEILQEGAKPLPYTVAQKQDISFAGTDRLVYRMVVEVDSIPPHDRLESTATEAWRDGNRWLDEFTAFIYLPNMDVEDVAYAVGEFSPAGMTEFRIQEASLIGTKWKD